MLDSFKIFESKNRGSSISEKEYNEIYEKNCKYHEYFKNNFGNDFSLYRGQYNLGDYIFIDTPNIKPRQSIEDTNIHLTLIDNLPSWKDYPSYSKSVISSTNVVSAYGYGNLYEVIPFDGSKVAFCPREDIWTSFEEEYYDEFGKLIIYADNIFQFLEMDTDKWVENGVSVYDRLMSMGKIDDIVRDENEYYDIIMGDIEVRLNINREEINGEVIFEYLNNYIFNPIKRGFTWSRYDKNYINNDSYDIVGQQAWTDGPCLLRKLKPTDHI